MELHPDDVVARDHRRHGAAIIHGRHQVGGVGHGKLPRMDEIRMRAGWHPVQDGVESVDHQIVPAHVRHLQPRVGRNDPFDPAADPAETRGRAVFQAFVGQHLHPHADPQERHAAAADGLGQCLHHAGHGVKGRPARRKGTVARQDDPVRPRDRRGIRGDDDLGAHLASRQRHGLFRGMQVAAVIVDQRDAHRHSAPLVDGSSPAMRGSGSTASRNARATALKDASAT